MILSASCGGTIVLPGTCGETSGLTVCSEGLIDLYEVNALIEILEDKTQEIYPEINNIAEAFEKRKVNVHLIKDKLAMGCEEIEHGIYRCEEHIGGVALDGQTIYVEYHECLAYTSFAHELLHAIEYAYLGGSEGDHDAECMFAQGAERQGKSYKETIEYKTNAELFYSTDSCADYR